MKQKILLLSAVCLSAGVAQAQLKAYAITGTQKGSSNWTEVRMVDVSTGEELKTIYKNAQDVEKLNARTGKPIAKKETLDLNKSTVSTPIAVQAPQVVYVSKVIDPNNTGQVTTTNVNVNKTVHVLTRAVIQPLSNSDAPFATTSAALAYDKKHDRLYYTPMGINELRYIDMKSNTTKIYYFEGEAFGALKSRGDVGNQVTRMVFGSDGKGYALTNNAEHLIQFEADKKPEVKDLGTLTDDPGNLYSVHGSSNYGGDLVADAQGDLYLIGANARVYKIDMKSMVATYKGKIKGLPAGFSTNGAVVEKDGEGAIVVCSSTSTAGYYRFDLSNFQAEKLSGEGTVYNASDLANGNLLYSKKKKKDEPVTQEPVKEEPQETPTVKPENTPATTTLEKKMPQPLQMEGTISVFPNPVTTGITKVSFRNYLAGKYQVQVLDISGKLLSTQSVTVANKAQVEEVRLPQYIAKGSYMIKVVNEENKVVSVNPIIVQ